MARIELRDCDVLFKDGLGRSGYAATSKANKTITPSKTAPTEGDTSFYVEDTSIPNAVGGHTERIPVGARFTIAGETIETVHVVTARTQDGTDQFLTTQVTFSPALGAGTYTTDAVVTLQAQQIEIKMGDGNLTYTEKSEMVYELDRDNLDTVKEGKQVPLEVKLDGVFEHITSGTGEAITPMEALKGIGAAAEWINASADPCEPYAINIEVVHTAPCGTEEDETYLFPDFRSEQREVNFKEATISVSGKCNITEPVVTRG